MAQSSSDSDMNANHCNSGSGDETSSSPPTHRPSKSPPPLSLPPPPPSSSNQNKHPSRVMPAREDCWSEEATQTLVNAWGERHIDLNRGNLRQKHWQEVADAVNAEHGHTKRLRRTDVQCKNRIDTIKKKYKIEKARTVDSRGSYVSPWPFYAQLDSLIGDAPIKKLTPSEHHHNRKSTVGGPSPSPATPAALALTSSIPVGRRSFKPKRSVNHPAMDDSFLRRTFAAAAAAATASSSSSAEEDRPESEEEEEDFSRGTKLLTGLENGWRRDKGKRRRTTTTAAAGATTTATTSCGNSGGGCKQLADAIVRFGEIYERVETMKQEQMVQLEKNRMEYAKELEFQRMKVLMDTQLQLSKIKRLKPSSHDDADSY